MKTNNTSEYLGAVEKYARKILANHQRNEYTYGGECAKDVLNDLKAEYPNGLKYPYIDVANAILQISRPEPIFRSPYRVLWDAGNDCCGCDYVDSLEAAKCSAEDTLIIWMSYEQREWDGEPTLEQKERWNRMIYNCSAVVQEYEPMTDEYLSVWEPNYELMGWKEIEE